MHPDQVYADLDDDPKDVGASQLTPESPVRLRECLTALAKHDDTHVLRFEVSLQASTRAEGEPSFCMTLTHSMGPEHELAIVPLIAKVFAHTMADFARRASQAPSQERK